MVRGLDDPKPNLDQPSPAEFDSGLAPEPNLYAERVSANFDSGLAAEPFSERQKQLIEYLKENKQITRKEYSDKFNISVPTAARDLKTLLKAGIIVTRGPAATGRYYELK